LAAITLLEKHLTYLESNSEIVHLLEVMALRSLILDLLDNIKQQRAAHAILSQMTSITTSLASQRNSAFDSPALERLYTTSAMRSQTIQVTAEYDSILQSKDAAK
jgi:hypothetical protein